VPKDLEAQAPGRRSQDRAAQLLRAGLDTLGFGFAIFDRDLRLVASNKAFRTLRGYPASLVKPGVEIVELYRYNARRGDYGAGDVEAHAMTRLDRVRGPRAVRARARHGLGADPRVCATRRSCTTAS
jgi:PAS domain-containing protein